MATTHPLIDDTDFRTLLAPLNDRLWQARKDKILSGREWSNPAKHVVKARANLALHDLFLAKEKEKQADRRLQDYHNNLTDVRSFLLGLAETPAHADFAAELLQVIDKVILHSPPAPEA